MNGRSMPLISFSAVTMFTLLAVVACEDTTDSDRSAAGEVLSSGSNAEDSDSATGDVPSVTRPQPDRREDADPDELPEAWVTQHGRRVNLIDVLYPAIFERDSAKLVGLSLYPESDWAVVLLSGVGKPVRWGAFVTNWSAHEIVTVFDDATRFAVVDIIPATSLGASTVPVSRQMSMELQGEDLYGNGDIGWPGSSKISVAAQLIGSQDGVALVVDADDLSGDAGESASDESQLRSPCPRDTPIKVPLVYATVDDGVGLGTAAANGFVRAIGERIEQKLTVALTWDPDTEEFAGRVTITEAWRDQSGDLAGLCDMSGQVSFPRFVAPSRN